MVRLEEGNDLSAPWMPQGAILGHSRGCGDGSREAVSPRILVEAGPDPLVAPFLVQRPSLQTPV